MEDIKKKGVEIYTLPQKEADLWAEGFQQVTKQWVADLEKQGKPAREAVEMYKKIVDARGVSCPAYPVEWH
jgi:TRAP-type C4-dicarboxylate transport system substrate-binding protein